MLKSLRRRVVPFLRVLFPLRKILAMKDWHQCFALAFTLSQSAIKRLSALSQWIWNADLYLTYVSFMNFELRSTKLTADGLMLIAPNESFQSIRVILFLDSQIISGFTCCTKRKMRTGQRWDQENYNRRCWVRRFGCGGLAVRARFLFCFFCFIRIWTICNAKRARV